MRMVWSAGSERLLHVQVGYCTRVRQHPHLQELVGRAVGREQHYGILLGILMLTRRRYGADSQLFVAQP
jgi:hypothetical protein